MVQRILISILFFSTAISYAVEPSRLLIPVANKSIVLDSYLYEPSDSQQIWGVILFVGGSGFTKGGFGGPSKFARLASDQGYIALEWNKRGISSNEDSTDILVDRGLYEGAYITNLIADGADVLKTVSELYPDLPIFIVGGSEGSIVTTRLAEDHGELIAGISTFGNMVVPFIQVVEHQVASQTVGPEFEKFDTDNDEFISFSEYQAAIEQSEMWATYLSLGFEVADVTGDQRLSLSELSRAFIRYFLIDNPEREQMWYRDSQVPTRFFQELFQVPSLNLRAQNIKVPTLILHGEDDWNTPIEAVYRLETQLNFLGFKNFEFQYFPGVEHSPSSAMFDSFLEFFNQIAGNKAGGLL